MMSPCFLKEVYALSFFKMHAKSVFLPFFFFFAFLATEVTELGGPGRFLPGRLCACDICVPSRQCLEWQWWLCNTLVSSHLCLSCFVSLGLHWKWWWKVCPMMARVEGGGGWHCEEHSCCWLFLLNCRNYPSPGSHVLVSRMVWRRVQAYWCSNLCFHCFLALCFVIELWLSSNLVSIFCPE